jgi:hypothetical protein
MPNRTIGIIPMDCMGKINWQKQLYYKPQLFVLALIEPAGVVEYNLSIVSDPYVKVFHNHVKKNIQAAEAIRRFIHHDQAFGQRSFFHDAKQIISVRVAAGHTG